MIIKIQRVSTGRPGKPNRSNHYGRPAVYFCLEGENLFGNLMNRRNRPHVEFRKVLDEALQMAGITSLTAADMGWSQHAGCTCPCSPGFIAKNAPLSTNVYVYYTIEEGEAPKTPKVYTASRLKNATMGYDSYPESKDYNRARAMTKISDATKMASLITDPSKVVRRLKAVIEHCPYEFRKPFIAKMKEMGFSDDLIAGVMGVKKNVKVMMPA